MKLDPEALKACPHCEGKAWLRDNQAGGWRVECDDCQIGQLDYTDKATAIAAWNRRALPQSQDIREVPSPSTSGGTDD